MARSKKTLTLGDVAKGVLKRADKEGKRYGAQAVAAWGEVVGAEVVRHTRGFALRNNRELVVFVDGGAWANQLSLMSDDLKERLNAHLGEKAIRSLRFTVSRKVKEESDWEALSGDVVDYYAPEVNDPAALDEVELQQAARVAEAVRNTDLREVAMRAMIKDLEQKKGARVRRAAKEARNEP